MDRFLYRFAAVAFAIAVPFSIGVLVFIPMSAMPDSLADVFARLALLVSPFIFCLLLIGLERFVTKQLSADDLARAVRRRWWFLGLGWHLVAIFESTSERAGGIAEPRARILVLRTWPRVVGLVTVALAIFFGFSIWNLPKVTPSAIEVALMGGAAALAVALVLIYFQDVRRNDELGENTRLAWSIAVTLGGMIGQLAYLWRHVWQSGSEESSAGPAK